MKFLTCYLMVATILMSVSNVFASDGYEVKGTVKGITSGRIVLERFDYNNRKNIPVNGAVIRKGKFLLKGKILHPEFVNVVISPGNINAQFFLENSKIVLKIDTVHAAVRVSGSANQSVLDQYNNNKQRTDLLKAMAAWKSNYIEEKSRVERRKIMEHLDTVRSLLTKWEVANMLTLVKKDPASAAAAYIFYQYFDMNIATMENILYQFKGEAQESVYYKLVQQQIARKKALCAVLVLPGETRQNQYCEI